MRHLAPTRGGVRIAPSARPALALDSLMNRPIRTATPGAIMLSK